MEVIIIVNYPWYVPEIEIKLYYYYFIIIINLKIIFVYF